jgi:hypothetical protein
MMGGLRETPAHDLDPNHDLAIRHMHSKTSTTTNASSVGIHERSGA